jgi:tryptophan 7-halogenase
MLFAVLPITVVGLSSPRTYLMLVLSHAGVVTVNPLDHVLKTLQATLVQRLYTNKGYQPPSQFSQPVGQRRRIAVIGAGTAGILTLAHLCTWLDESWDVVSIYDPNKPILGIGESTNGEFVALLERATHFGLGKQEDMDALDATIKFGSKFSGWREQSWINPLLDGNTAIHFNNFNFRQFVFAKLEKLWPKQFSVLEGDVKGLVQHPDRVTLTLDATEHEFDFVVDCMGFPTSYDGYTLSQCTPINRCQIHSIQEYTYEPYTDHIATANGWMFGVPLKSRKTFGYMYNDTITPKADAQADMKRMLGVDNLDDKEYIFNSYYANTIINGRVLRNGNKALFFEPLVANSMFIYITTAKLFTSYIQGQMNQQDANAFFVRIVQELEDIISYYYQGGSTHTSQFWDYAIYHTRTRLAEREAFKEIMTSYRTLKRQGLLNTGRVYGFKPLTWEIIDEELGYHYIDTPEGSHA